MFFTAHPILTARWLARITLVIMALALFNFSAGVSITRTRQSAAVHHIQLFGGLMPIHVERASHHYAVTDSQVMVVVTQGESSDQTVSFGFGLKISNPGFTILNLPPKPLVIPALSQSLPAQPYLALPPKPPQI